MEHEIEIWKPVPSKPGIEASSWGRIKVLPQTRPMPNGGIRTYETKPTYGIDTKASKQARHLYKGYFSRKYGNLKIHRLVCEAFHGPAPFDKAVVIHLDEDGLNNKPANLKWGSQKENLNMPKFIDYCKSRVGENSPAIKGKARKLALEKHG